ncbi:MAG: hypothetical protein Q9170_006686 [Blastenia crenularia]
MDPTLTPASIPPILFRVLHDGVSNQRGRSLNPTPAFDDGYLLPRDLTAAQGSESIGAHLSWTQRPTPYISLCTWQKAKRVVGFLERVGARNITIVAFDASAFPKLLDAYQDARRLGFFIHNSDRRRRLENHVGEYLAWSGYHPDTYKLLLVVSLMEIRTWTPEERGTEILHQVYMHTGVWNEERTRLLLSVMES